MAYASATFPGVTAFDGRVVALRDYRRAICSGIVIGLGAVTAVGVMIGAVTAIAAWLVAASLATNPNLHAKSPFTLKTIALDEPHRRPAGTADVADVARVSPHSAEATVVTRYAELTPPATLAVAPASIVKVRPKRAPERANIIPLPPPRPPYGPRIEAKRDIARPPVKPAAPQVADTAPAAPAAPAPASFTVLRTRFTPDQGHDDSVSLPARDSHTALYDIETHTVYLPNGERLEAHSGMGDRMDDPRFVSEKDRGATPPNVYDLVLREGLFHGVRAIRLNPVGDAKMFNRAGILAHPYMLGPSGQSFGCVSFKDYPEFLQAFLNGEVARLVVVPHLGTKPSAPSSRWYAAAD